MKVQTIVYIFDGKDNVLFVFYFTHGLDGPTWGQKTRVRTLIDQREMPTERAARAKRIGIVHAPEADDWPVTLKKAIDISKQITQVIRR